MKPLKFAFVGCGKIAHFHADVVKHLGHSIDVVAARKSSVNIDGFAEKYSIKKKIYGIDSFSDYCNKSKEGIDCILLCTSWDVTENALRQLVPLNLPIMTEKPAVLAGTVLDELKKSVNINNLFIAYNRRFYDFIPFLKGLIEKERLLCVDILSADPYEMILKTKGDQISKHILYYYTSHVIDLMFYILGDLEIKNIVAITENNKASWVCTLYAKNYKCPIHLKILMDCPQNSSFKFFLEKKVIEIKPLEKMLVYDKLQRRKDNEKMVYLPLVSEEKETDRVFKPGFLNQLNYFIENFVYKRNFHDFHIKQLEKVTIFCDILSKNAGEM